MWYFVGESKQAGTSGNRQCVLATSDHKLYCTWQIVALLYKCSYISFVTVWSVRVAIGKEGPPSCRYLMAGDGRLATAHLPTDRSADLFLIYSTIRPDEGKNPPFDPAMLAITSPGRYLTPTHPCAVNTSFCLGFCPPLGVFRIKWRTQM